MEPLIRKQLVICSSHCIQEEHRNMVAYAKKLMEYDGNGVVTVNPSHTQVSSALRTTVAKGEGILDKEATSQDDLLDAFKLSLQYRVGD
jgi:hypothetical protein